MRTIREKKKPILEGYVGGSNSPSTFYGKMGFDVLI